MDRQTDEHQHNALMLSARHSHVIHVFWGYVSQPTNNIHIIHWFYRAHRWSMESYISASGDNTPATSQQWVYHYYHSRPTGIQPAVATAASVVLRE